MAQLTDTDIREQVRARYAAAATAVKDATSSGCCGGEAGCVSDAALHRPGHVESSISRATRSSASTLYADEAEAAPKAAVEASLGCGVPTAVADLSDGEVVLDLGSGAGADVLISARRVAPGGRAIGLDMTDEMLELARANARRGRAWTTSSSSRATSSRSRWPTARWTS